MFYIAGVIGEDDYYVPNIIFGTDYSSYLMFYRCHKRTEGIQFYIDKMTNFSNVFCYFFFRLEVWILTRQQNMTQDLKRKIQKYKHKINFLLPTVPQRTVCDWPL